jgi:hypothetical protein
VNASFNFLAIANSLQCTGTCLLIGKKKFAIWN